MKRKLYWNVGKVEAGRHNYPMFFAMHAGHNGELIHFTVKNGSARIFTKDETEKERTLDCAVLPTTDRAKKYCEGWPHPPKAHRTKGIRNLPPRRDF